MRRFLFLLLALASGGSTLLTAGCSSRVGRYEGDPIGPDIPPLPPEHVMRRHPDFRFVDHGTGKEYLLRLYSDENVRMEIVTVRDPGRPESTATEAEREFALSVFVTEWRSKGMEDRLRWHLEGHENERRIADTLLDRRLADEEAGLRRFRERRDEVLFNLRARKDTGVHPKEGDELSAKFHEPSTEFLERELARLEAEVRAAEARTRVLEYEIRLRNARFARSAADVWVRDSFEVSDLLGRMTPDGLVARVKREVDPESWIGQARAEVVGDQLVVVQTRTAMPKVREFLLRLRREKK